MCIYIYARVCVILLYYNIIYIIHHSLRGGDHFCPLHAVTCQYRNGSSMIFIASFPRSPAPEPLLKGRPSSCTAGSSSPARQVQELRHFGRSQCRLRPTNMDGWWSYNWNPHKGIDNQWPPNIWYSFSLSNYWRWLKWPWKNWEKLTKYGFLGTQKDQTKPFDNGKSSKWGYVQMSFSERIVAGTIFGYDWFSLIGGIGN